MVGTPIKQLAQWDGIGTPGGGDLANALRSPNMVGRKIPKSTGSRIFRKKKLNCGIFPSFPMDFPIISQKIMQKKHRNWKMMGKSIIFQFLWFFACFLRAALQLLWLGPWGSGNLLLSLSLVLVVSRQGEDGCNFRWSSNVGSWKTYEKLWNSRRNGGYFAAKHVWLSVGIYSTSLHETIQRISWRVYCSCNFYSFDISLTCDSLPQPLRLTGHPAARNSSESSPWTHWYGRNAPNTSAFHGSDQQSIFGTETWQSPVFFCFFSCFGGLQCVEMGTAFGASRIYPGTLCQSVWQHFADFPAMDVTLCSVRLRGLAWKIARNGGLQGKKS